MQLFNLLCEVVVTFHLLYNSRTWVTLTLYCWIKVMQYLRCNQVSHDIWGYITLKSKSASSCCFMWRSKWSLRITRQHFTQTTFLPGMAGQSPVTCSSTPGLCSMHRGMSVQVPSSWKRRIYSKNTNKKHASFFYLFLIDEYDERQTKKEKVKNKHDPQKEWWF